MGRGASTTRASQRPATARRTGQSTKGGHGRAGDSAVDAPRKAQASRTVSRTSAPDANSSLPPARRASPPSAFGSPRRLRRRLGPTQEALSGTNAVHRETQLGEWSGRYTPTRSGCRSRRPLRVRVCPGFGWPAFQAAAAALLIVSNSIGVRVPSLRCRRLRW